MSQNQKTGLKETAKVARKHLTAHILSNIFGYFLWAIIYAAIIFGGTYYAVQNEMQWSWLAGILFYCVILVFTFFLRIRRIYKGMANAALDAAEEMISRSDHKAAKTGAKGFKLLRWLFG